MGWALLRANEIYDALSELGKNIVFGFPTTLCVSGLAQPSQGLFVLQSLRTVYVWNANRLLNEVHERRAYSSS
jgi:hypothetical protein